MLRIRLETVQRQLAESDVISSRTERLNWGTSKAKVLKRRSWNSKMKE